MFLLSSNPINPEQLKQQLQSDAAGACVTFEGLVRNHNEGQRVKSLAYEAYADLCSSEAKRIFDEVKAQFPIHHVVCVHRVGTLKIGDLAVWVGVSASHRDEGFKACRYVIDEIKSRLPIWKKEFYANGDSGWIGERDEVRKTQETGHKTKKRKGAGA